MAKLNDLDKLHIFDTIHDFKADRDKKKVSNEKQDKIKFYFVNFIKTFLKAGNNITKFNDVISYLTNGKVQSLGEYERNIEHYYETFSSEYKTKLVATTKESITYGDIIRSANDRKSPNSPWVKYKALYGIQNGLTIGVGNDQEYTSFGMVQKNNKEKVIADFILNYMFPGKESNKNTFYFTADTKLGTVKKIFRDIKEAHSLITPANIADSAGTELDPFIQNRNDFIFPTNKQNTFEFNSNFYTKTSGCRLSFANNKFSDKNKYGFLLNIQHQKNNYTFNFSEKEHTGPSVSYLGDLIINDPKQKPKDPDRNMLNINRLLEDKTLIEKGFLLDLKRTGDYEQVNSATTISNDAKTPFVILTTIDILCSLYARINQQNNILIGQGNEEMTLYRFAKGKALDPDVLELQRNKYQLMETVENIIILRDLQENRLFKDIEQSVVHWNRFFKDGQFKSNNPKQIESEKTENIVTLMIKIRISDILKKLNILHAEMQEIEIPDKKIMESYRKEMEKIIKQIETSKGKKDILTIKKNVQKVEKVITYFENIKVNTILNRTFELNSQTMKNIHEGKNPLELDYIVYDDSKNKTHPLFKHTGNSNTLNFSNATYNNIFNKLYNFDRIISSNSSRNRDKKLYDRFSCDANDNYFNYVKSIYDSFFDKSLGEEFYNITNPPKTDNESVMEWYNALEIQLEKCLARNDPSTLYVVDYFNEENMKGGSRTKRKRDDTSPSKNNNYYHSKRNDTLDTLQCRELSDLLRSIAGIAAGFIESIITNQFGEEVPSIDALVAYLQQEEMFVYVLEVVQEIEIVWVDGIMNIQRNINNAYDYVPTESEYLVLNMLSYYFKDRISNDFDDENMQLNKDFYYVFIKDDKIRPSKRRTSIQATTKLNDIGGLILNNPKNIPAEIIHLLTLTLIDNTMQGDRQQGEETTKKGYFYHLIHHSDIPMNFFDNQSSWNDLPRYLYVYISYIVNGHSEVLREFRKISGGYTKKRKSKNHRRNNNRKTKRNN